MRALGSLALLLLTSAVSAQKPPTERLLFNAMIWNAAAFELLQAAPEAQQVGRDRVGAPGTDRNPGTAPAGANKDLAGPDIRPGDVNPSQTVAPEPATLLLLATGLALVGAAAFRKRRSKLTGR